MHLFDGVSVGNKDETNEISQPFSLCSNNGYFPDRDGDKNLVMKPVKTMTMNWVKMMIMTLMMMMRMKILMKMLITNMVNKLDINIRML